MPTLSELSQEQFKQLLDEYFAPPERRSKMTEKEIIQLAERLNGKINIPILSETSEEKILVKIILKVDRFLYDNLPNEFYDLVRSVDKGIDDDEADRLIKRLSRLANKHIDIPYIPEAVEFYPIHFVIAIIINAARRQWDLSKAEGKIKKESVPASRNASDSELEGLLL